MQNVAMWRFLQFVVYASLILDRLTFHASKEFNSIIAPNKATKQSRDLNCVYVFIHHTFIIEVQTEQYVKATLLRRAVLLSICCLCLKMIIISIHNTSLCGGE